LITVLGIGRKSLPTEFDRYEDAFRRAGLETDRKFEALKVNPDAAESVQKRFGAKEGRWIGLAPFAKSRSNMLPYRVTKETIDRLTKDEHMRVFLFGAGEIECEMLRQWASVFPRTESVAGQLSLAEELELMRKLDVMICMDSANQHLSSLVGLRAVSVWCATHPIIGFAGWKQRPEDIVQRHDLPCRPCTCHGTNHCRYGNYACRQIEAETIIRQI
jgi:ADP-heptose:LPS heptosyltransferase